MKKLRLDWEEFADATPTGLLTGSAVSVLNNKDHGNSSTMCIWHWCIPSFQNNTNFKKGKGYDMESGHIQFRILHRSLLSCYSDEWYYLHAR